MTLGWKRWLLLAIVLLASGTALLMLVDRTMRSGAIADEQRAAHDDATILATSLTLSLIHI